jgi:hypothetical protein
MDVCDCTQVLASAINDTMTSNGDFDKAFWTFLGTVSAAVVTGVVVIIFGILKEKRERRAEACDEANSKPHRYI